MNFETREELVYVVLNFDWRHNLFLTSLHIPHSKTILKVVNKMMHLWYYQHVKKNIFRLQLPNYLLMHLIHGLTAVRFESHKNMTRKRKLEISKPAYSGVVRRGSWTSHWSVKRDSRSDFKAAAPRQIVYLFWATPPPMLFMEKLQKVCCDVYLCL